jgi:uncharacterized protein (TIGR02594 family)
VNKRLRVALIALCSLSAVFTAAPALAGPHHIRHHYRHPVQTDTYQPSSTFFGSSLVAEARKYLGTNPTGRGRLWCGAFMDLILKRTGHPGGGNLALGYEHYGTRVSGPQVGAIAVMGRRGRAAGGSRGGHVGVVAGVDANGNPIIVSGNHNHTVAEAVYPKGRIAMYVMPPSN